MNAVFCRQAGSNYLSATKLEKLVGLEESVEASAVSWAVAEVNKAVVGTVSLVEADSTGLATAVAWLGHVPVVLTMAAAKSRSFISGEPSDFSLPPFSHDFGSLLNSNSNSDLEMVISLEKT